MGTLLAITLAAPPRLADRCAARAFRLAARSERRLSRFDPTSALSRVNRAAGRPVTVPREVREVLGLARRLAAATGGAFDPTAAPLVDLWHAAGRAGRWPPAPAVREARARTGWRGLRVRGCRAGLARPGMALDLGGIAKGWAVDRIACALGRVAGLAALINFGESSLAAVGEAVWPIVLRHPGGGFAGWFRLRRGACSTSSSLGRAWRLGRRTVGHVVDPRSGRPVAGPAQATVVAASAAVAEAASTALLVLGRPAVPAIARRLRAEVLWIDAAGSLATAGFVLEPPAAGARA